MKTKILANDKKSIEQAAQILNTGGTVAFPTETVYGLGADARNPQALKQIFDAKRRPNSNPLIIHVADMESAQRIAHFNKLAARAADCFWPGPMTLLLPKCPSSEVSSLVAADQPLIGIRIPSHPVASRLLVEFAQPVAAPSANLTNRVSPTRASHVLNDLDGRIDALIDGGDCHRGLESTILWPQDNSLTLLRLGALEKETIFEALGVMPEWSTDHNHPKTPGQHGLHYSPELPLRINVRAANHGEIWIGFGSDSLNASFNLSEQGDLNEAAANLYATLRMADETAQKSGCLGIAIAPVPDDGMGVAINDRLRRAAAKIEG